MSDGYTKRGYGDGEERAPGMFFLREELGTERLGFTVLDIEAGWSGLEHDHAGDGQEEVYHLVSGEATLTVDGDELSMADGDTLRVAADATRQIRAETDCYFVVASAA